MGSYKIRERGQTDVVAPQLCLLHAKINKFANATKEGRDSMDTVQIRHNTSAYGYDCIQQNHNYEELCCNNAVLVWDLAKGI